MPFRRLSELTLAACLALCLSGATSAAEPPQIETGRRLAARYCGECHATGASGPSPLADAPPFRTLPSQFDVDSLPQRLEGGMLVGHPRMPLITLDPDEVVALTAYLKSFVPPPPRRCEPRACV
jgi:cytochrome c